MRQICLVATELEPVAAQLEQVLQINPCFEDEAVAKFGLQNRLWSLGSQFIEVVSPIADNTAAGRFMQRRGGDSGYMVICQAETLEEQSALRARAEAKDVRVVYEKDHSSGNYLQLHPADMGAAFLEVDWDQSQNPEGNWHPAGDMEWIESVCKQQAQAISAVELQSEDPKSMAKHWAAIIGTEPSFENDCWSVALANAKLRFVSDSDGRGPGLSAIEIRVHNREKTFAAAEKNGALQNAHIMMAGTRFVVSAVD